MDRAEEVRNLLTAVQNRLVQFIEAADRDSFDLKKQSNGTSTESTPLSTALVDLKSPQELQSILKLDIPASGQGQDGLLTILDKILRYSVNTWHQGFLDKLYASTNAPGVAAELILATLNTNVHVYQVSPALTLVEKYCGRRLAELFGFNGPHAGGISVQGGSASNTTSIVVARNHLFPSTKEDGYGDHKFVLFTSAHGHYSIEKAAQMLGFGSNAAWAVPVDAAGRMIPAELERLIQKAGCEGRTPFYVNATAGTTVLGSFDPFDEIAAICRKHKLWFHIDGSWGGPFVFSQRQRWKLAGAEKADSIAINPHKMLGTPVTCSFLLGADLRKFHRANTLPAGYLFHNSDELEITNGTDGINGCSHSDSEADTSELWDLADLTLQCGRRGDSLKLFLSWTYYGSEGYENQIDSACGVASYLADLIADSPDLILVSERPPPCLQVCFYYAPSKELIFPAGRQIGGKQPSEEERGKRNSKITEEITKALISRGFMVDFAPPSGDEDAVGKGKFFRCVVNVLTKRETAEALVKAVQDIAPQVALRHGNARQLKAAPAPAHLPPGVHRVPGERGHGPVVHHH